VQERATSRPYLHIKRACLAASRVAHVLLHLSTDVARDCKGQLHGGSTSAGQALEHIYVIAAPQQAYLTDECEEILCMHLYAELV
jgi:hypothetical protein